MSQSNIELALLISSSKFICHKNRLKNNRYDFGYYFGKFRFLYWRALNAAMMLRMVPFEILRSLAAFSKKKIKCLEKNVCMVWPSNYMTEIRRTFFPKHKNRDFLLISQKATKSLFRDSFALKKMARPERLR